MPNTARLPDHKHQTLNSIRKGRMGEYSISSVGPVTRRKTVMKWLWVAMPTR